MLNNYTFHRDNSGRKMAGPEPTHVFPPPFFPDEEGDDKEDEEEEVEEEEMTTEESLSTEETPTTVLSSSTSVRVTYRRLYPTLPPLYSDDEDEELKKPVIVLSSVSAVSSPIFTPTSPQQFEEEVHDTSWNYENYEHELTEGNNEVTDVLDYETVTETFLDEDEAEEKLKDYPLDYLLDKIFNITKPYDEDDFEGYRDNFFGSKCEIVYVFFRQII